DAPPVVPALGAVPFLLTGRRENSRVGRQTDAPSARCRPRSGVRMDTTSTTGRIRRTLLGSALACALLALLAGACILLSGLMIRGVEGLWGGSRRAQDMGTTGQYFDA